MSKAQSWTPQEDRMLIQLHKEAGCFQRWKFISKKLKENGVLKTQFQCRDRFTNHVDPTIKRGKLSKPEIAKLFGLYDEYGPRWSFFENKISGRPQNLLKNKFYSTLRSLVRHFIKAGQKRNLNIYRIQSSNLSSKLLTDLYEGRKKFLTCKNMLKTCLKNIEYCLEGELLQNYLNGLASDLLEQLYFLIHQNSARPNGDIEIRGNNLEQQKQIKCQQQQVRSQKIKKQFQQPSQQQKQNPSIQKESAPVACFSGWGQLPVQGLPTFAFIPIESWNCCLGQFPYTIAFYPN